MDKSEKLYNEKIDQVIWKTIVSDTVTPISILMRLEDHSNCFLLESVEGGGSGGGLSGFLKDRGQASGLVKITIILGTIFSSLQ